MGAAFYDEVLAFVEVLDAEGHTKSAREIEDAVRGGATGGEILTYLALALSNLLEETPPARDAIRAEATRLLDTTRQALRAVGQYPTRRRDGPIP
jgi:hypothetical protein